MKILFVCQQYIHSARWINQLKEAGHEIYLFDCLDMPIHKDLKWTNYIENWSKRKIPRIKGEDFLKKNIPSVFEKTESFLKVTPSEKLIEIIKEIQPDLVHSLEMQSQTYHVLKARKKINFKWAYFSWGSDLYLYQKEKKHLKKMRQVFSKLDWFFTDNTRDIYLAKEIGFSKKVAGVFPGGGGYHLDVYKKYMQPFSERKLILIKGYHHWVGRALQVLNALELIVEDIREYDIYVYSAHEIVVEKIEELNKKHQLCIEYSSRDKEISHEELLKKFGQAKIAIGNSISDGIPNTLLEAIILGAFPIQSNPGKVSEEYIIHGENGFLIDHPENIQEISELIFDALSSQEQLEKAFYVNQDKSKRLAYKLIQTEVLEMYSKIESEL